MAIRFLLKEALLVVKGSKKPALFRGRGAMQVFGAFQKEI